MPKVIFAAFCQQALVDRYTNNISIVNQYDMVQVGKPDLSTLPKSRKKKPRGLALMQCAVVTVWERERPTISETTEMLVELFGPKKESLAKISAALDLRKSQRARHIGNLPGLPIAGEGTYRFVIRCRDGVKWRRAAEVSFQLTYSSDSDVGARVH